VYAFPRVGPRSLTPAYLALTEHLDLDAIVLVDGGTDILMRGDEAGLGTPEETPWPTRRSTPNCGSAS
jgi:hypothetical protein